MNPFLLFGLLGLGGAAIVAGLIFQISNNPVIAWLIGINLSALVLYRVDKNAAQAGRLRVPEAILLLLEAVGGTMGAAIAMWMMQPRHKTQSGGFLAWFFAILVLQIFGIGAFVFWIANR
jgi:uncharacterized membrane protein YsdA (DUF1294 family)